CIMVITSFFLPCDTGITLSTPVRSTGTILSIADLQLYSAACFDGLTAGSQHHANAHRFVRPVVNVAAAIRGLSSWATRSGMSAVRLDSAPSRVVYQVFFHILFPRCAMWES